MIAQVGIEDEERSFLKEDHGQFYLYMKMYWANVWFQKLAINEVCIDGQRLLIGKGEGMMIGMSEAFPIFDEMVNLSEGWRMNNPSDDGNGQTGGVLDEMKVQRAVAEINVGWIKWKFIVRSLKLLSGGQMII